MLNDLKRSLEIVEYEPNKIISFRRLRSVGVTEGDIRDFRDAVYEFAEAGAFFNSRSLRRAGFESELYELGFSDWFYDNLLLSDPRFAFTVAYKAIILIRDQTEITLRSFEEGLIRAAGSVDVYDLQRELEETYGCDISDRQDLINKVAGGSVYYDRHLDRLYDSENRFWNEVDDTEGVAK